MKSTVQRLILVMMAIWMQALPFLAYLLFYGVIALQSGYDVPSAINTTQSVVLSLPFLLFIAIAAPMMMLASGCFVILFRSRHPHRDWRSALLTFMGYTTSLLIFVELAGLMATLS